MTAPRTLAHIRTHRPPLETTMTNPATDDGLPTVEKLRRANADLQRSLDDAYTTIRNQAAELRAATTRRPAGRLTITLCGSLRRAGHDLRRVERALALAGHLVHAPCPPLPGERPATDEEIRNLTGRHLAAIDRCDLVAIVAPDGRIGRATGAELDYALDAGKRMRVVLDVDALVADVATWIQRAEVAA